jgi:DNA polymerase-3 subunit chi
MTGERATEIRFYHLERQSVEQALPPLLNKALSGGRHVVIKAANENEVERINDYLWSFNPDSFIPHGSKKDGFAALQPVWITATDENPNKADVLIVCGGVETLMHRNFSLCCEMIDGRDESQIAAARTRWKAYKESDFEITYWQQVPNGWEKKG